MDNPHRRCSAWFGAFDHDKPIPTASNAFGKLLVASRKKVGLTQKKAAETAGIPRKWVGRWERGRAIPGQTQWSKLATVLNLPTELKAVSL
jgi:DNA-binding transcriptional regulator YiaG